MNSIHYAQSNLYLNPFTKPLEFCPAEKKIQAVFNHCMRCLEKAYRLTEELFTQIQNKVFSVYQNLSSHLVQRIFTQTKTLEGPAPLIEDPLTSERVEEKKTITQPPPSLINTAINTVGITLKNFGIGLGASIPVLGLNFGISSIGGWSGLLPKMDRLKNQREYLNNLVKLGIPLDVDSIMNASCYFEEFTKQYNPYLRQFNLPQKTPLDVKLEGIIYTQRSQVDRFF